MKISLIGLFPLSAKVEVAMRWPITKKVTSVLGTIDPLKMVQFISNKYGKCTEYLFGKAQYDVVNFYKFELLS